MGERKCVCSNLTTKEVGQHVDNSTFNYLTLEQQIVNASHSTDGFGGLEQGVNARKKETNTDVTVTTSLELGKFFPDKAKVSAPLYYSVTKSESRPKYNPLDTDMLLDAALDGAANQHERDSIESIAVTKRTTTNFSLSNMRVGIQNKRHPMPYDPANFSFSYSHSHSHTTGENHSV